MVISNMSLASLHTLLSLVTPNRKDAHSDVFGVTRDIRKDLLHQDALIGGISSASYRNAEISA